VLASVMPPAAESAGTRGTGGVSAGGGGGDVNASDDVCPSRLTLSVQAAPSQYRYWKRPVGSGSHPG
jgi:hypothetical protein